jgi:hypothetical protein
MKLMAAAFGVAAAILTASSAFAEDAWVVKSSPGGDVLVNQGAGYTRVGVDRPVRAGDQVIAQGGGEGWLVYCGCDVPLRQGKVYTVEQRECPVESVWLNAAGLPHVTMLKPLEEEELTRCRAGAPLLWAAGAAGAAVGICAIAGCFDDDDKKKKRVKSVSP